MALTEAQTREQRRQAIYRAGVELFLEHGFERATMRELARRAGVGLGTIYSYFSNKDAILLTFLDEVMDRLSCQITDIQASGLPVDRKLERILMSHLQYLARHLPVTRLLFVDSQQLLPESRQRISRDRDRYHELLCGLIKQGQQQGMFRKDVSADWMATALLGAMGAVVIRWLSLDMGKVMMSEFIDFDTATQQALDVVLFGICQR